MASKMFTDLDRYRRGLIFWDMVMNTAKTTNNKTVVTIVETTSDFNEVKNFESIS